MSVRRLLGLLAAVAAVLGLAALPVAQAAQTPAAAACDTADDTLPAGDGLGTGDAGLDDSGLGDDAGTLRQVSGAGVDDPSADAAVVGDQDLGDDQTLSDDPGADDLPADAGGATGDSSGDCPQIAAGAPGGDAVSTGATSFPRVGPYVDTVVMPSAGRISERLVAPKAGVVGRARRSVAKAGTYQVRIRLNGKGRRLAKGLTSAVTLRLRTTIRLRNGRTLKRTRSLTLQPR